MAATEVAADVKVEPDVEIEVCTVVLTAEVTLLEVLIDVVDVTVVLMGEVTALVVLLSTLGCVSPKSVTMSAIASTGHMLPCDETECGRAICGRRPRHLL